MNFLFAWRYFKAKKSTNAINIIAWVSVLAIAFGTAAIIFVLSIFNGFENLVKSLYADFYTDLRIIPAQGKTIAFTAAQQQRLAQWPGIKATAFTIEEKAMVQNGDFQTLVQVKGVDEHYEKVNNVARRLIRGRYQLGTADHAACILGSGVENALAVESDRAILPLVIYLPKKGLNINSSDPLQSLSADNIVTAGAFAIQQDFDNSYLITNSAFVQRMLGIGSQQYSAAEIALTNTQQEKEIQQQLQAFFGNNYTVQTRYQQNKSLYTTMQLEKWFIFLLLCFILVIAAFTMIGALTMLVLEKQKDIQILKAMGANNQLIQKIFLSEGLLLAAIGGISGLLIALLVGWLQIQFGFIALEGQTFIIDRYPVKFLLTDILLVLTVVTIIALAASWFPSRKAATEPAALKS